MDPSFPPNWPKSLCSVITKLHEKKKRISVVYSDGSSEKGYVGFTTGNRTPLLRFNRRSMGGGTICSNVIRVEDSKKGGFIYWDLARDEPILFVHLQ
jgi:hypothetical protein